MLYFPGFFHPRGPVNTGLGPGAPCRRRFARFARYYRLTLENWPLEGNRPLFHKFHTENPIQASGSSGRVTGAGEGWLPLYPPLLRSRILYRLFHDHFPNKCPVAFQWLAVAFTSQTYFECLLTCLQNDSHMWPHRVSNWPPEGNRPLVRKMKAENPIHKSES